MPASTALPVHHAPVSEMRPAAPPKSGRRWLLGLFAAPALVGAGWWAATTVQARQSREGWSEANVAAPHAGPAVMVTAESVTHRRVQRSVEAVGTLWGYEAVTIGAKVNGRVLRIRHDVADRVAPDEILLEIEPTDFQLSERQSEKALQVELAKLGLDKPPDATFDVSKVPSVVQAKAKLDNARRRLDRIQSVDTSGSREEVSERTTELAVAQAEHDNQVLLAKSTLASVRMKQESWAMARQQMLDTVIRVPTPTKPVPGGGPPLYAISARSVAEGSMVSAGTELFKLVIDQTLKLKAPVPERFAEDVKDGQDVQVQTAAYATPFAGTVRRINPTVDSVTRTFEVEIEVPNDRRQLKSGSFAKAAIQTRVDDGAVTVPLKAVVNYAGVTKIFLIENGKAKEVQVTLGVQSVDWVEIRTPALPNGAMVVTSGQSALADGTAVQIRAVK
ncbi:MAG: efflux RND transporter periplasmic adaptor subunit [Gemmataceae bacterium]